LIAREVNRIAGDNLRDRMLANETDEGAEVVAEAGAGEGEHGLGGEAEGVREGNADAAVADVET